MDLQPRPFLPKTVDLGTQPIVRVIEAAVVQAYIVNDKSTGRCVVDDIPSFLMSYRREQGGRRYVELDRALLAVVPLWQAEVRTVFVPKSWTMTAQITRLDRLVSHRRVGGTRNVSLSHEQPSRY